MKQLNVCYAANNEYIPYVAVSICSLLENNKKCEEINVFILCSEDISSINSRRITAIAEKYTCIISFIMVEKYLNEIKNTVASQQFFLETYARLFVARALPGWIHYCFYLDADTIICNEIGAIDVDGNKTLYAVKDIWRNEYNKVIGFSDQDPYYNAGVLYIDLDKWKKGNCQERLISHLRKLEHPYRLNDQDLINIVLKDDIGCLDLKYNMLPVTRSYTAEKVLKYCNKNEEQFYGLDEIKVAKKNPIIIHFAGGFFGKPWEWLTTDIDAKIWKHYFKLINMEPNGIIKTFRGFRMVKKVIKYITVKTMPQFLVYIIDLNQIKKEIYKL